MTAPRWEDAVTPLVQSEVNRLEEHLRWARQRPATTETERAFRDHEIVRIEARIAPLDAALARLAEPAQSSAADGIARARLDGVRAALDAFAAAHEVGGVTATRLAHNLGYTVGDLYSAGLQAVANMIGEASEAPKLREVLQVIAAPYHVETPEHAAHVRHARDVLGIATTPREPTAAERWRAVPADVRRIVLRWVERGQAQAHRDNVDAYHALLALAREAEGT